MRYCGLVAAGEFLQLTTVEELRTEEPPVRLVARFYEPSSPAAVVSELQSMKEGTVVGVGSPLGGPGRAADRDLLARGVPALPQHEGASALVEALGLPIYAGGATDTVDDGAYTETPVFETHPDGVFCALRGIRLPAKRHPFGIALRIEELLDEHVEDEGGDLWHRRIEELEAVAVALAAHRFAVGHACWVGDPGEGVIVLPGSRLPELFSVEGAVPPVPRRPLPPAG
jgi:predicted nuclease with RNAse H fold